MSKRYGTTLKGVDGRHHIYLLEEGEFETKELEPSVKTWSDAKLKIGGMEPPVQYVPVPVMKGIIAKRRGRRE